MRYPTPYIHTDGQPARLRDIFIPLAAALAINVTIFNTAHFSNKRGAETVLHEHGYTSITIQEGPSWRRADCNGAYLTHYTAIDKNGAHSTGAICQRISGRETKFLPK